MKKLIQLSVFLFCLNAPAQEKNFPFVAFGFDVKNATFGSKPTENKPAIDFQIKAGAIYKQLEIGIQYENFTAIEFQQYGLFVNYVIPIEKYSIAIGIESGSIIREGNSNWLYLGANSELRYDLHPFIIGLQANYRYRPDIEYLYRTGKSEFRGSGFLNVYYKFK